MGIMTEEEIDEVLYFARANEIDELKNFIPTLFPKYGTQPAWILSQAVDAETGNTALHYASANGHLDMVTYLLTLFPTTNPNATDLKTYLNKQNTSGNTPLHWSALNGRMEVVQLLLTRGADASILNFSGHDAVYEAEINDKQDVAEYLLKEALGLEKAIGREGDGIVEQEGADVGEGEAGDDVGLEDDEAGKVADGMREMDLKGGMTAKEGGTG